MWVCSVLERKVQSSNGDNWWASQEEYTTAGKPRLCGYSKSEAQALKPAVVLPAAATSGSKKKIARDETLDSDSDEIENFEESDTDIDVMSEGDSSIIDDDNDLLPTDILRSNWETLSPPVPEEDVLGKWYTIIYATKQATHLYLGKILKHFLLKDIGDVDCL